MKKSCPECQTLNEIDESQYQPGDIVKIQCQLCGTNFEAVVPESENNNMLVSQQNTQSAALDIYEVPIAEIIEPEIPPTRKDEQQDKELERLRLELELLKQKQEMTVQVIQQSQQQQYTPLPPQYYGPVSSKSKTTAGLLALFLGGLGIHKFYLGKHVQGILYLVFCWTYIPTIIAFFEAIGYFCQSDERFAEKYQ